MGLSSTSGRIPAPRLTIAHHRSSSCFCKTMAKDINEMYEVKRGDETTVRVRVVFENVILVSNKKVSPSEVKYMKINIQKLPKNRTVTEETSERLYPTTFEDSEVRFNLKNESFDFSLTQNGDENASQYEIELEVMQKNELSCVGSFDVRLSDLDSSQKTKWRKISSNHKRFQIIELRYGIFPIQCISASPKKRKESGGVISVKELSDTAFDENNPFHTSKLNNEEEKTDGIEMTKENILKPNFQPGSCIMVGISYKV